MKKLNTIDLFAGAGGLSYGFIKTKHFDIKVAVESNINAQNTYKRNHQNVHVESDIRDLNYQNLEKSFGSFDVVLGGPPCQGFSNANRQKNELISNNNQLIKEYIRAVEELKPDVFVMENVKAMCSAKHKFFCTINDVEEINSLGIVAKKEHIPIAREVLYPDKFITFLKTHKDIENYALSKDNYAIINSFYKSSKSEEKFKMNVTKRERIANKLIQEWDNLHKCFWCEDYKNIFLETKWVLEEYLKTYKGFTTLKANLEIIIELHKAMYKVQETFNYNVNLYDIIKNEKGICVLVKTYNVLDYITKKFISLGYELGNDIVNAAHYGVPQARERYIVIGIKKSCLEEKKVGMPDRIISNYYTIGDAIMDLAEYSPSFNLDAEPIHKKQKAALNPLQIYLNDSDVIYNHIVTETTDIALSRFKKLRPGQNFHNLEDSLKATYSDPSRTQNTIYQRLNYDQTSGTVLNVRKSMWIHPQKDRAISIREAARLQSFPDSFVFSGPKDSQYQQIGNAVPPLLSRAIAEKILDLLSITKSDNLVDL